MHSSHPKRLHHHARSIVIAVAAIAATAAIATPALAEVTVDEEGLLTLQGDLRARFEADYDSQRADGTERDDRNRARYRVRLGARFQPEEWLTLAARVRTGSTNSQQSPHVTFHDFDDNPTGDHDAMFDQYYLSIQNEKSSLWFGRNLLPLWKQNELFWDDDVTVAGISGALEVHPGTWLRAGYFAVPNGGVDFGGTLAFGQGSRSWKARALDLTLASGVLVLNGDDEPTRLRNGNGARDYTLWASSVQAKFDFFDRPARVGLDYVRNLQSYSADDPNAFTAKNENEKNGFVFSSYWGNTTDRWDVLLGYTYAYIETLALNASFAQDDWVRWGSATQTDSSDLKGSELRVAVGLHKNLNLNTRLWLVDAITSKQDGKRFRIDLNYKL